MRSIRVDIIAIIAKITADTVQLRIIFCQLKTNPGNAYSPFAARTASANMLIDTKNVENISERLTCAIEKAVRVLLPQPVIWYIV